MKNLTNCTPKEFAVQGILITKAIKNLAKKINLSEIRKKHNEEAGLEDIPDIASPQEKLEIEERNREKLKKAGMEIMLEFIEQALGVNADETIRLLAYCCFVNPDEADNHNMSEYFGCLNEMLNDKNTLDFFFSVFRLLTTDI